MLKGELPYRTENLSKAEKSKLLKRFWLVLAVAILMSGFIVFLISFFQKDGSFGYVPIIFEIFFFGILLFIVIVHGLNAFQVTKKIYTGIITDKYAQSTKFRNSSQQITHYIQLDDVEFSIDQFLYDKCHKGDKVELHVLGKGRIFEVAPLEKAIQTPLRENYRNAVTEETQTERKRNHIREGGVFYPDTESLMTADELKTIRQRLVKAVVFRTVLGAFAAYIVFMIILFFLLFTKNILENITNLYWPLVILVVLLFLWLNRKTYRLLRDLMEKKVIFEAETVLDLERSNMPKPSQHSIVTYQGYTYRSDLFFYIKTEKHWTEISQELYEMLQAGDKVYFKLSKNARIVLNVTKKR